MTEETYKFVIDALTANYSTAHGVIGQFKTESKIPLSLCISTVRNRSRLVPDSFCMWQGERMKAQGKLKSQHLKKILMKEDPCRLEITNAKDMEFGPGEYICLKEPCEACGKCPCINGHKFETAKEEESEAQEHINSLWVEMTKVTRKLYKNGNLCS